jgi:hypothetical protein
LKLLVVDPGAVICKEAAHFSNPLFKNFAMSALPNARQFILLPDWITANDFRDLCAKIVHLTDSVSMLQELRQRHAELLPNLVASAIDRTINLSNDITGKTN